DNAVVYFKAKGVKVDVTKGKIAWNVSGDKLDGFTFSWGAKPALGGMRITGMPSAPLLLPGGGLRLPVYFALPAQLGGGTSTSPVNVDLGVASAATNGAYMFKVQAGGLAGIPMANLVVSFQGVTQWNIDASVTLPQPVPLKVEAGAAINNGVFA